MKRVSWHLVYAAAVILAFAALAESAPNQKKPFTLTLETPKQPLKAGRPLTLRMTTTNTSGHALSNLPMTQGSADVEKVYQVHVLDGEGHPAPPRVPPPPPKGKTLIRIGMGRGVSGLQPGQSVTDQVNVTALYDLSQPGKYKIWIAEPFCRGPHIPNGFVRSNTVTVIVVK